MSPATAAGGDGNPDPQEPPKSSSPFVSLSRSPDFWLIIRYAALMGVVLAFGALAFLGLVKGGTKLWFDLPKNPDWMSGSLWWVAVTAGAGLLVGVLRHVFRLPLKLPGTVPEIKAARVEPTRVLKTVAVSLVSLVGGASLGPEAAMGTMGGGLGTWISESRRLSDEVRATNTLVGMAGAYGALLSTPYVAVLLLLEVGRPKARQFSDTWVGGLLCASVAFAVFFPIAGSSFIGVYTLPSFAYEDWQLAAAVPLGLLAGAFALVTVLAIGICTKLTAPLTKRPIIRPMIGGIAFGLVGVALPLTLFTGSSQLKTVISSGPALGAGLLIGVVLAKILVFALCEATGFIGGPFFPMLFIGGTAGIAAPADPGAAGGARVHDAFRGTARVACRGAVHAHPARRTHHPDWHAANGTGRCRRARRVPRRLRLRDAHGPGAQGQAPRSDSSDTRAPEAVRRATGRAERALVA